MTIQVGLRVRPFIGTEGNSGPSGATATANDSYIEKDDSAAGCDRIILHHPKKGKRAFTFNKVFLDSPVPSSSAASSSGSVSTSSVYEGFVRAHVTKVLEGYNACMLLYGETGSGKSYTLWGRAAGRRGIRSGGGGCDDSGILHLAMKDIFERTKNHSATKGDRTRQGVDIECSMMQVYDENMYDLLSSTNGDDGMYNPKHALKVCRNPALGQYVQNLTPHTLKDYEAATSILSLGNKARVVLEQNLHMDTTRSHTIISFVVRQYTAHKSSSTGDDTGEVDHVVSKLVFVDLAGSETLFKHTPAHNHTSLRSLPQQSPPTHSGPRHAGLVPGSAVDKLVSSLSPSPSPRTSSRTVSSFHSQPSSSSSSSSVPRLDKGLYYLSRVMDELSKNAKHTSFSESVLTQVLEESLSRNSFTSLLATVHPCARSSASPKTGRAQATLSVLRYCQRVMKISVPRKRNINHEHQYRDELRRQILHLSTQIENATSHATSSSPASSPSSSPSLDSDDIHAMREALQHTAREFKRAKASYVDRVKEADTFRAVKARVLARSGISMLDVRELFTIAEEAPRIVNISTDPSLSGMVCYFVKPGTNMIGTRKGAMVSAKSSSCRDGDENYIVLPNNTHPPFTLSASHAVIEYAVTAAAVDGQVSSLSMNDDSGKGDTSEERRKRKERRNGLVLTVASADFNDDQIGVFVNGRRITVAQELWNGDRILFGSNHYFQVIFPARSREEGCTALVSHSEALRERDAWKSQYDNLSRMSMLNQKLLEAASEGWKKKYAHSLKKTLLMSKELKRAQQAEQSVRQRLEEEQIRARGKQEELKHQTKLRMSELQMRLEMENEKKLLAQAAEDLAQQIHVLEEGKMIQEADMLRKHRQEIGAYEAKLVALHASLAKAQAQAQDRSLILVTVEDASSPCRKTDSRGSGSDSGGAVGAVDMQHVLAMKLIKKEADAWKRKHQKALVNTMKMKKKLEQDAASALRSAMTEAAGEYKTQLAALQAENETLKDLRKTELKQAAATTKELDAQLVAENTRLEKMIMGEFEKLHAHNEEVTELVQKQQVKMEQQHQESMERAAAFEESVSTELKSAIDATEAKLLLLSEQAGDRSQDSQALKEAQAKMQERMDRLVQEAEQERRRTGERREKELEDWKLKTENEKSSLARKASVRAMCQEMIDQSNANHRNCHQYRFDASLNMIGHYKPHGCDGDADDSDGDAADVHHRLILSVKQARELAAMDINGYSDPYVRLVARDADDIAIGEWRTRIKRTTLNPVWNEGFDVSNMVDKAQRFVLDVWDDDYIGDNDYLGQAVITVEECIQLARDAEKDAKEREKEQKLPPPSTDAYYKSKDRQMAAESWYNLKSRPYYQDKVKGSILIASYYEVLGSDVIDSVFLRKKEPWDLSRQELICQWEQLDRDGNGSLSLAELTHLAASYFQKQTEQIQREMNLRREQVLTILLKNKPLEKHLKELAIEMDEYFDVNKDGVIRRREFVTRWNSFAKHHFQAQSMGKGCAIC